MTSLSGRFGSGCADLLRYAGPRGYTADDYLSSNQPSCKTP